MRLVVVDDEADFRQIAAAVQDLVLVGRLEFREGVGGFQRRALHAHGDQLLLGALGLIDIGAGERRRNGLSRR
ncbi:hypothetical protein D3C83_249670 [compost metagenome]